MKGVVVAVFGIAAGAFFAGRWSVTPAEEAAQVEPPAASSIPAATRTPFAEQPGCEPAIRALSSDRCRCPEETNAEPAESSNGPIPWPAGVTRRSAREAWDHRLDAMDELCPDRAPWFIDLQCDEYPCLLVTSASPAANVECGLPTEGRVQNLQSEANGEPLTVTALLGDGPPSPELDGRVMARFQRIYASVQE